MAQWTMRCEISGGLWSASIVRDDGKTKVVKRSEGHETREAAEEWAASDIAKREADRDRSIALMSSPALPDDTSPGDLEPSDKLQSLVSELEAMHEDVHVAGAMDHGHGMFGLKVYTPLGAILDTASRADWLETVRDAVGKAESARCPFCRSKVNVRYAITDGRGCGSCGAIACHGGTEAAEAIEGESLHVAAALEILRDHERWIFEDTATGTLWVRRWGTAVPQDSTGTDLTEIEGPSSQSTTIRVPLLVDVDAASGIDEMLLMEASDMKGLADLVAGGEEPELTPPYDVRTIVVPDCRHCIHALHIEDERHSVGGVEHLWWSEWKSYCINPLEGESLGEKLPLDLRPTRIRGYRTDEMQVVLNAVRSHVLDHLRIVDKIEDDLEAMLQGPSKTFVGPICASFEPVDPQSCRRYDTLMPTNAMVEVTTNVIDMERLRSKSEERRRKDESMARQREVAAIMRAAMDDRATRQVIGRQIDMKNLKAGSAKPILARIAELVPHHLLQHEDACESVVAALRTSNKARGELVRMLLISHAPRETRK